MAETPRNVRLKPAPGALLRNPSTRAIVPAEGLEVERSPYWLARLADGSAVEIQPDAERPRSASTKAKGAK